MSSAAVTEFPGLEELSQQTYEIPFAELALRLRWDIRERVKRMAADDLLAALKKCDNAFVAWQVGQIPGRPEDILALIAEVRAAIAKAEGRLCKAEGRL